MSKESLDFDPTILEGVSVSTVFEKEDGGFRFPPSIRERLSNIESERTHSENEPALLFDIASDVTEGKSLRQIAISLGVSHKNVSKLLQAAGIPYAGRGEALKRLWRDPEFRAKNQEAQAKVRGKYWQDPEKRASAAVKLRASALKQWEDPEFRELVITSSSVASRQRWQDPDYRAKMAEHGFPIGRLMSDPDVLSRLSESRRRQWEDPEFRADHLEKSMRNLAAIKQGSSYRQKRAELQRERWQDPEYRRRMTEASSEDLTQRWQDPSFRAAAIERARETMTKLNKDPSFQARAIEARRAHIEDPEFREDYSERRRQIAIGLWEDPEYIRRQSDSQTEKWKDPEYREKTVKSILKARGNPDNRNRYVLPTIHGYRSDIDFYAQSAWEANVARVLQHVGRDYIVGESVDLEVTEDFDEMFPNLNTRFEIDFVTTDRRGRKVSYEIMAHPFEDPEGWAKAEMMKQQYPDLNLKIIDQKFYKILRRFFEGCINKDPWLAGWEKKDYNLNTHQEVFA